MFDLFIHIYLLWWSNKHTETLIFLLHVNHIQLQSFSLSLQLCHVCYPKHDSLIIKILYGDKNEKPYTIQTAPLFSAIWIRWGEVQGWQVYSWIVCVTIGTPIIAISGIFPYLYCREFESKILSPDQWSGRVQIFHFQCKKRNLDASRFFIFNVK